MRRKAVSSKHQLQSDLDGTWTTNLIERIESAGGAPAPEASAKHGLRDPEGSIGIVSGEKRAVGIRKVRVIEDVECLRAKLKSQPFLQAKVATDGQIELIYRKRSQEISRQVALPIFDWRQEWTNLRPRITGNYDDLIVESSSARHSCIFEIERYSLDEVWPKVKSAKPDVPRVDDVDWRGGAADEDGVYGPILQ